MAERIQLRRAKGWKMPPNTVNVARPGPWGNPFKVGKDGTREECVRLYRLLMGQGLICLGASASANEQKRVLDYGAKNIGKLLGKNLACWCRNDGKPCHADVLLEVANSTSLSGVKDHE